MGTIFNIQKFCVNDGPGIRTTIFMKGCPLDCIWCHNPESKQRTYEIFFTPERCINCQKCSITCKNDCHSFKDIHTYSREQCVVCGECAKTCMSKALEIVGYEISAEDAIKEVLKDKAFYETSGGGVTISGGEPMHQFDFTYELLTLAKKNALHTCIETCGFAKEEQFCQIADLVDIFLYDYKETNPQLHKEFTGVSNELILKNIKVLDKLNRTIILRCPIIPGFNNRIEHFDGIASLASKFTNIIEINIEPYHPLGKSKAERLNKNYSVSDIKFADKEEVNQWIDYISKKTSVPVKLA